MATTKSKAKSAAKKPAAKTNGKPGVIAAIIRTVGRERGATLEELVEILSSKFPDREPDSMRNTARIQVSKNQKRKDRDEKRGLVYFGKR